MNSSTDKAQGTTGPKGETVRIMRVAAGEANVIASVCDKVLVGVIGSLLSLPDESRGVLVTLRGTKRATPSVRPPTIRLGN